MAKKAIEQMNFTELRQEVADLSNELARMKRTYEDLLYNLDLSNFSGQAVKEANNVKSTIVQTAEKIKTEINERKEENGSIKEQISTFQQTADGISTKVQEVVNDLKENYSTIEQTARSIESAVETVTDDLVGTMDERLREYSTIEQTAKQIKSVVYREVSLANTELAESSADFEDKDKIYRTETTVTVMNEDMEEDECVVTEYFYYDEISKEWKNFNGDGIYSVFVQTADGFELRGNVTIDGGLVVGLARVADTLYIGEEGPKSIVFADNAQISTVLDGLGGYSSIKISGATVYIESRLDLSNCRVDWGENQPVCVFGNEE